MMNELQEKIVAEAYSWLGTRHRHQGRTKGYEVDCDNFVALVAQNSGVALSEEWVNNYRAVEDGRKMLALLEANLAFVSDSIEDAQPADVIAFCDELLKQREVPRHLGILSEWRRAGVPYAIHASESGVVCHRLDAHWKRRVHSIWRVRELAGAQALAIDDNAAIRLAQLKEALGAGLVGDPATATILGSHLLFTIVSSAAVSTAVAVGTGLLTRALTPRPKQSIGQQSGEIQITQSGQGLLANEVYGGDPGDGKYGCKVAPNIIWTGKIQERVTVSRQQQGGGKGFRPKATETTSYSYDISLALLWGRGELDLLTEYANTDKIYQKAGTITGIIDPDIDPDDDYDHLIPPDPGNFWTRGIERAQGQLLLDAGTGTYSGTTAAGGYAPLTFYPGNTTQEPDPTIEADVDTRLGADSTPAYRNFAYNVHKNFSLTPYGNFPPNFLAVLAHANLHNLEDIYNSFRPRVGRLQESDLDFSALSGIISRGLLISGRRFAPAEIIDDDDIKDFYNYYVTEKDGQIVAFLNTYESVVTIPESELGYIEDDDSSDPVVRGLSSELANETSLPRRVEVGYSDPDKDFDHNVQSEARQITTGVGVLSLDVRITATSEEARAAAARKLYNSYVRGTTHSFTLSNKYAWLWAGAVATILRNDGSSYLIQFLSITGSPISIQECEAVSVDVAAFTHVPVTDGGTGFEEPPAIIPAMSIAALMDTPLLRDKDATENNGAGFYFAATPRTGEDQSWQGASLWVDKVGWERIADTTLPATMGRLVSFANLSESPYTFDNVGEFVFDLFGTTATLESAPEVDVLNGANPALSGDVVIQWKTAERVEGFLNRWKVTGILHGRRGTEYALGTHVVGERFVLLNEAVQFIPIAVEELGVARDYRCVTVGQSLDDAATLEFAWLGMSVQSLSVVNITGARNSDDHLLIEWTRRSRLGQQLRDYAGVPLAEEAEVFEVVITNAVPERTIVVVPPYQTNAVLESDRTNKFDSITGNTAFGTGSTAFNQPLIQFASIQRILDTGNFVDATLTVGGSLDGVTSRASIGLLYASIQWRTETVTPFIEVRVTESGGTYTSAIYVNGISVYSETTHANGTRWTLKISESKVSVFADYKGRASVPVYETAIAPTLPLRPYGLVRGGGAVVSDVTLTTTPEAKAVYTAEQQTADGITPGSPVDVRIYQMSALVGRGQSGAATL